jgi:HEAT repeat protein
MNFKNPDNISQAQLDGIVKYFRNVTDPAELAQRAVRYLIDGEDEAVLLEIGGSSALAQALLLDKQLYGSNVNAKQIQHLQRDRAALFWSTETVAPVVWMRLGQVFASMFASVKVRNAFRRYPDWLTVLIAIVFSSDRSLRAHTAGSTLRKDWPISEWRRVFEQAEVPDEEFVVLLLDSGEQRKLIGMIGAYSHGYFAYHGPEQIAKVPGWKELLADRSAVVGRLLTEADAAGRVFAMNQLIAAEFDFTPLLGQLVDFACGSSKTVRDAVLGSLAKRREAALPLVEKVLEEGDTSQRHEAVQLLWRLMGDKCAERLRRLAEGEKSDRIKQTIDKLLAAPTGSDSASSGPAIELSPMTLDLSERPLPEKLRERIRTFYKDAYVTALANYERIKKENEEHKNKGYRYTPPKPKEVESDRVEAMIAFVEGSGKPQQIREYAVWNKGTLDDLGPPEISLLHVVRLAFGVGHMNLHDNRVWWHNKIDMEAYRSRCSTPFGLRELDAAAAVGMKLKPGTLAWTYLINTARFHSFLEWDADMIWPAFAERPEILREALSPDFRMVQTYWIDSVKENAFKVLAMFPSLPVEFVPLLWDLALGETKTWRPLAQAGLATVGDKTAKILVALGDGKQAVRAAAADWLGKLGDKAAIEPLKEAFRNEKQEAVKGAIMLALDALGADVDEFLDRKKLLKEAEAGLGKKRPRGMEWFPLDQLPPLHWSDKKGAVDPKIVEWWVVQHVQQKSPVPGPIVRRYLSMCKPEETASLVQFVLRAWIGHDTKTPSHEEATAAAMKEADTLWNRYGQQKYFSDMYKGSKDNLYREILAKRSSQCLGSAIDQKGMLALVAAAGDRECVKLCESYIRNWFGQRAAQCKALVEVLAWMPHPNAVQVLLSIGNRFRTKSIRDAAAGHVQELAERQGWTLDELADRTIPEAGFTRETDDEGRPIGDEATLVLDFGPRTFTVKLDDDLEPIIATDEGKTVKNLPAPGKNDDAEKAKAAKKSFSDAKKSVKEIVKRQSERLYEALCTQRTWKFDDWKRYLAQHPIVGRLCSRVVWANFTKNGDAEKFAGCFRLLEDGTLTNEKDDEVHVEPDAIVRLAHTCNVPTEVEPGWIQHLADYDVEPLFDQFDRPTYTLPEEKRKETSIADFEGYQITTFKLRGKATKLGYIRGTAEDGGVFTTYRKPFSSLGLEAVINFTGSMLPEQEMPASLMSLEFHRVSKESSGGFWGQGLALGKIPPVLLSEAYNDMKRIAAEGSGHDPKWKDKSYF